MYACPHCSATCYSILRRVFGIRRKAIICERCGGQARLSDIAGVVESVGAEFLVIAAVILLFLGHWWAAAISILVAILGLPVVLDFLLPLVPLEPVGSAAHSRRAALHFWLIAPIFLALVIIVIVAMLRR
jgi:hypothetical protein